MVIPSLYKTSHFINNTEPKVEMLIYEDYECEYCYKAFYELKTFTG